MKISLYLKIVFLLVFSWVFISVSMGIVFNFTRDFDENRWEKRSAVIAELIGDYIGDPPDMDKVQRIAEGFNLEFVLSETDARADDARPRRFQKPIHIGEYTVYYRAGRKDDRRKGLLLFVLFLGGFFVFLYFIIRKILKPVKELQNAATRISEGNFDVRLPRTSRDELGDLVNSFNLMADDLERMIRNRDQLIMDVSHELRSPLARLKVALALINEPSRTGAIRNDLREMEELTGRLLDFYRLGENVFQLNRELSDAGTLLEQVAGSFDNPELIRCPPAEDACPLFCDPFQLGRVIRNLIENGLRHSPGEGVLITMEKGESELIMRFRDYGPGVPPEHRENVFEPFFRLDGSRNRETGGFGIGLALSRRIAEAHDGELSVQNHPEGGAEFILRLPCKGTGG